VIEDIITYEVLEIKAEKKTQSMSRISGKSGIRGGGYGGGQKSERETPQLSSVVEAREESYSHYGVGLPGRENGLWEKSLIRVYQWCSKGGTGR